ncbi:MAG: hypothetical protein LBJ63_00280 [Prevotellaceae bacterium]|jgi:hypothetical protein|nr:hypothetical protein [Prevotellaceae bacterium]
MKNIIGIVFIFCVVNLSAQTAGIRIPQLPLPEVKMPQVPNPYNHQLNQQQPNTYSHDEIKHNIHQSEAMINEMYEMMQRREAIEILTERGFMSQSDLDPKGTGYFYAAFDEINAMLKGEKPLSLERTVFLVENAFYNNSLDYSEYKKFIRQKTDLCERKIGEEKLNRNNNMVKNMMLFRLISDTLLFKNSATESTQIHLPVKYDYDDYNSKVSYDSHFVTKLMRTGIGQCHSMPLYYLILAEAIEAEAYWSFSPRHSFVKIKDEKGIWYNMELTCSAILSDAHYMNSGYIKAEAIRNRLYLEPLDKQQIIAELLIDLAKHYHARFGLDDFYLQCADAAAKYLSCDINAIMLKTIYQESLTLYLAELMETKTPEIMKQKSPEAYNHYIKMQKLYKQIDDLGYEQFPDELYVKWLNYIAQQKEKAEQRKTFLPNEIK